MYRFIFFIILSFTFIPAGLWGEVKRPVLRWGVKSSASYALLEGSPPLLYPASMQDTFYFSLQQSFSPNFALSYRSSFSYSSSNRECSQLGDLYGIKHSNSWGFTFKFSENQSIRLNSTHSFSYKREQLYYSFLQNFSYNCKLNHLTLTASYSAGFTALSESLFKHRLGLTIYWTLPRREFLKFRSSLKFALKQGPGGEIEGSLLDGVAFSFELILDLNRLKLEEFYEKEEDEVNM